MKDFFWKWKNFEEISKDELYEILSLRQKIFIVEQNSPFVDADFIDQKSLHLICKNSKNKICAYLRVIPPDIKFSEASFGRVFVIPEFRKNGLAKIAVQNCMNKIHELYGNVSIKIDAQIYLKKFYEDFGFVQIENPFDDAGVLHITMIKK